MFIEQMQHVIEEERDALNDLTVLLNDGSAETAVQMILHCTGKVIFMGIGKSGHICEKLAATFSSTGTPSFFVHCAECFHGDFGMIEADDLVILVSNSGKTEEVVRCVPIVKKMGCKTVAITKDSDSPLAKQCDCVLRLPNRAEADHLHLAPTVSSTATLALGDSLACAVSQMKGFSRQDFYKFHPGGALGAQLSKENRC